ncbi:hypothetical protein HK104_006545 [Borealophlyctis nickersoniae]|nr:hypothetical protein HK104_006545 [Borealophlyctis nickersoniae]
MRLLLRTPYYRCCATVVSSPSIARQWGSRSARLLSTDTTTTPLSSSTPPPPQQKPATTPPAPKPSKASKPKSESTSLSRPHDDPKFLKVYVFPTSHQRYVFHARLPKPRNKLEHGATVLAYAFRKWRYQVADFFAAGWHAFGAEAYRMAGEEGTNIPKKIYTKGNKLTTRVAADEYFFKTVPKWIENIEFIYPASMDQRSAKAQLIRWMGQGNKQLASLVAWGVGLAGVAFIAKAVGMAVANILFSYNIFRINAHWRGNNGYKRVGEILQYRRAIWTPSEELDRIIQDASRKVTESMEEKGENPVWRWEPNGDLHDEVLEVLEKDLRAVELTRTYRRARLQYYVHNGKDVTE